jgi:ABC-type dipeptide/oligopeptide/nickel transport system permease subunit
VSITEPGQATAAATGPIGAAAEAGIADVAAARPLRKDVWRRFRRNKLAMVGLFFLVLIIVVAIFAPLIAPYGITERTSEFRAPPSSDHLFGTDRIGRDVFSRVVYGARVSLRVGILATLISLVIGVVLGAIAGFFSGVSETVIMRVTDIFLSIPYIILAIALATVLGRGENTVIVVLGVTGWLAICRIVRSSFLSLRQLEYVDHVPPHTAERPAADHRLRDHRGRERHPGRGRPVVPGRGCRRADAGVGADGRRGPG